MSYIYTYTIIQNWTNESDYYLIIRSYVCSRLLLKRVGEVWYNLPIADHRHLVHGRPRSELLCLIDHLGASTRLTAFDSSSTAGITHATFTRTTTIDTQPNQCTHTMPPTNASRPRGRPPGAGAKKQKPRHNDSTDTAKPRASTSAARRGGPGSEDTDGDPFADSQPEVEMDVDQEEQEQDQEHEEEDEDKKIIPPELLTRILHEFFEKDGTRISKDANKAVGKYMDVFVREAIARAAVEKGSGFLEVSLWTGPLHGEVAETGWLIR
jgi:centromere protein X